MVLCFFQHVILLLHLCYNFTLAIDFSMRFHYSEMFPSGKTVVEVKAMTCFPVIDPVATGTNILRLRLERGLSVRDLQRFFGFEEPQAIYKWQRGQSLPSVDNLYALGALLDVTLDEILVPAGPKLNIFSSERQSSTCRSSLYIDRLFGIQHRSEAALTTFPSLCA